MTRGRRLLWALLLLAAAAFVLFQLLSRLERYEEVVDQGPSPEVRQNPYLAATHFLERIDSPVQLQTAVNLPREANHQTLLLLGDRSTQSPAQVERLLAWVERGGHLVFVAEQLWDETRGASGDLLLDRLGLQQYESDESRERRESPQNASDPQGNPELTRLFIGNETTPAYLAFDTRYHLYDAQKRAHAWANSAAATHMLQLRHGQGTVTGLTDAWIWQNDRIDQYDHAWLLWYLTQDNEVTLVHASERAGLATLLLRHFPEALVALALALAAALWHYGQRHGPIQPDPAPARRELREHLRASADFLYRRGAHVHLIETLQRDVIRCARLRHPGFDQLDAVARDQALARLTRQSMAQVSEAMARPERKPPEATAFTRRIVLLQTLRNAL